MSDLGWTSYISRVEEANWMMCFQTASRHGHTKEEAEECDERAPLCPDCPFKKSQAS